MSRSRAGPLLLAALALLAGDLCGLAPGVPAVPPVLPLLTAAFLVLGTLPGRNDRRGGGRGETAARLAACLLVGLVLGSRGAAAARRACAAALAPGDSVEARGRLAGRPTASPAPGPPGRRAPPLLRAELVDVRLSSVRRRCRLPRLRISLPASVLERESGRRGPSTGTVVRVTGHWWSPARADRWPRSPARAGFLRGRSASVGPREVPSWRERLRGAASERLRGRLPADVAPLGLALVLADRSGLDPRIARRFAEAGLAHLLAISGLHVGILAAGTAGLLGLIGLGRRRHAAAALLALGYVALLGFPAAALRAAVLVAGWAVARTRGSPVRLGELLGLAAAVAVVIDPLAPLDAGFQLSFAGFVGLGLGAALARRGLEAARGAGGRVAAAARRARRVALPLAAGAGAFGLTALLAASHFGRAAPIAVLTNLVGVPLVTLALAGLAGALVLPGVLGGGLAASAAAGALRLLEGAVDRFAALPFGHAEVAPPGPLAWLAAGLLVAAAVQAARGLPGRAWIPALAGGLAVLVAGPGLYALRAGPDALLCSLDVGQGDAAVLRTRRGHWVVFDAGPRSGSYDAGLRVVTPFLRERGARSIALFVLSHPHLDHLGGAPALLAGFPVERVLDAGNPLPSPPYADFLAELSEEGVRWLPARPGERMRIDEADLLVLGPDLTVERAREETVTSDAAVEANEGSVAVRVRIGGFTYVNPGDASAVEERWLLGRWPADSLRAILLKVGHHGSRGSSSAPWLAAVAPRIAFISSGAGNRYGHPHAEALARLREAGVRRVWRSDRRGTLCLEVRPDGTWRMPGGTWMAPGVGVRPRDATRAAAPTAPRRPSPPSTRSP
jgi:competence protein ComEC